MSIPKIIHYCWFGGNNLDDLSTYCIDTWKVFLPDYHFMRWDETTFAFDNCCVFLREAIAQKKWAFVSDYVRAWALYTFGGIYFDTDVEVKHKFDDLLTSYRAFSGFEMKGFPFTAVWGAEKGHSWPKIVIEYYEGLNDFSTTANTLIVSKILEDCYHVNPNDDSFQLLPDGIAIFPSETFCVDKRLLHSESLDNLACHHFNSSWVDVNGLLLISGVHKSRVTNSCKINRLFDSCDGNFFLKHYLDHYRFQSIIDFVGAKNIIIMVIQHVFEKYVKKLCFRI